MRKSQVVRLIALFFFLAVIVTACGGGGGGDSTPDTTPNAFSFSANANAPVGFASDSESVSIAGIDASTSISINGGEYSVNGGEFTSGAGTVSVSDTVQVRVLASTEFGEISEATLTIGGVAGTYTVTTAEPDAFTFGSEDDAEINREFISEEVTLRGITGDAPIVVINGEYSIAGGDYVSGTGTITAGQTVRVRTTSAGEPSTGKIVTLTIGGVAGEYIVTTIADTDAPVVNIVFPPENSMTESDFILVRGTATDLSTVSSLSIVATSGTVVATSDDGFATWEALVPLDEGGNTLTVSVMDGLGNFNDTANEVRLLLDDELGLFPNDLTELSFVQTLVVDVANNRLLLSAGNTPVIHEVNLATGERRPFSDSETENSDGATITIPNSILIRGSSAIVLDTGSDMMYSVNLESGERSLISDNDVSFGVPEFSSPRDMIIDPSNSNQVWVLDGDQFFSVNLSSGLKVTISTTGVDLATGSFGSLTYDELSDTVFIINRSDSGGESKGVYELNLSNNEIEAYSTNITHPSQVQFNTPNYNITSHSGTNALFIGDVLEQRIVKVNLISLEREIFSGDSSLNVIGFPQGIYPVEGREYILVPNSVENPDVEDGIFSSIHAIDVINGNRVIVTKWQGIDS